MTFTVKPQFSVFFVSLLRGSFLLFAVNRYSKKFSMISEVPHMNSDPIKPSNLNGGATLPFHLKVAWRAFQLMVKKENRLKQRQHKVSPVDALFNFAKLSFLKSTLLKYRHPVQFGDSGGDGQHVPAISVSCI